MTVPDVSVVVPVYNTMPYLTGCLTSLVEQTVAPGRLHVVAVDDGSTDGSGEELDRFASAHPEMFTVLHQANSGGPANPCNNGLDVATGRYVFFLGADDRLDPEAVERMVAAADEWGSDVLACRLVGEGGRWVNQRLFEETAEEIPFPSTILATALSNTKLFRRSVIEEHHIRFPEDLRVGSDQPFTIEAMLRARKVSVLADRPYYFAVKREGADNITYTSTWLARLRDLGAVVRRVADLLPAGEGRDMILQRHFQGEIATLLRRDFAELAEHDQQALVDGVNELTSAYLTDGILARLRPLARVRFRLASAHDFEGLRQLIGAEEGAQAVHVSDTGVHGAPAVLAAEVTDAEFLFPVDRQSEALRDVLGEVTFEFHGSTLVATAPAALTPESATHLRVTLVNAPNRSSWGTRFQLEPDPQNPRSTEVLVHDGRLEWRMDLSALPRIRPGVVACFRFDIAVGSSRFRLPVFTHDTPATVFTRDDKRLEARVFLDERGRALIEIERSST